MEDLEAYAAPMNKLTNMGLDNEVLKIFKEAEKKALAMRNIDDERDGEMLFQAAKELGNYLEEKKEYLLKTGNYTQSDLDEQFTSGTFYICHVGATGQVP